MFEEEFLIGDTERSIVVQTRRGRSVANVIEAEPGPREKNIYATIQKRFGHVWINRKPPCGVYNCYGMVFASRRTSILDDGQIADILRDDGYRTIPEHDARVADLVLYKDRKIGLLHVARVTHRHDLKALHALSKWNPTSGEDEHHIRHHCWTDQGFDVELEFWTDRP